MSSRRQAWGLALAMITLCSTPSWAKRWVEVKAFSRFILYIDVDSIYWKDENHAELFQMTVLTEEGRRYFKEGYEGLSIPDDPPAAVVTWEYYSRQRRRRTSSRVFLDDHGQIAFRSDTPTEYEVIVRGSLYDAVWRYLFEPEDPEDEVTRFAAWQRQMRTRGLMTI